MALATFTLNDKYTLDTGRVFLNGSQALVRLTLMQKARDEKSGLNTAGFVSGYRGSPLGNVDKEFWNAAAVTAKASIRFQPGVNEDLAATAVWGTQQTHLFDDATVDGVFAMWYGKGPGVDRSGDVFRHGNMAGTAPKGGVLVLAGDDPACKSSTVPSQSEYAFVDAHIPILNPANVQDIIDYGQIGWAMSRYAGVWVGMKTITENMDSSSSVSIDPDRIKFVIPEDFDMPEGGLHIRWPDAPLEQEQRLQQHKMYAALAFAKANKLDKIVIDSPDARLGIITTGKSYLDVMQALDDLGIDPEYAAELGLRIYKVAMPWPLERDGVRDFADGLEEILVVEEKRAVMENQLKEQLYNWREDVRPRVVGKFDEEGNWVLPSSFELSPARIARVIAARLDKFITSPRIHERLDFLEQKESQLEATTPSDIKRVPYFCAGCPHNTSTVVPDGSKAAAGIGCHYMVTWMDRDTTTFTHMGAEGANWNGLSPFVETDHMFVNLGDGTYFHSGLLAIRAAIASNVNITYKILYNDAVAMTGGQPHDGPLNVPMITRQVSAEGVKRIAVVSDEPNKYPTGSDFPSDVTFHHRDDLDLVQRELREIEGVSIMVFDQTCAAELRRRRKRGMVIDPPERIFINDAVCEGCGDCGIKSNCVAITPVETPFGRKRAIDQSSCNKDFSCLKGLCPSFVSVTGATVRKSTGAGVGDVSFPDLPTPELPSIDTPYSMIVTGIGGTGVVTIGALLGVAAHIEGKGISILDQTGLAQKNGAVMSHVRVAANPGDIYAARIPAGGANLLLGCDMVTAGGFESLSKLSAEQSFAVINSHRTMTAAFTKNPDLDFPDQRLRNDLKATTRETDFIDASSLATGLLGDSLASNLFTVGYAFQKGWMPLSADAIEQAITLNGVAIDFNKQAFLWGRRAAHDLASVEKLVAAPVEEKPLTSQELTALRTNELTQYQNAAYADRYCDRVTRIRTAEAEKAPGMSGLTVAVEQAYFKLLATKDEYEVARLFTDGRFEKRLKEQFEGSYAVKFHLAPPLLSARDPLTGEPRKSTFGAWVMPLFKILAALKGLRGTPLDIFGYSAERRLERRLLINYEKILDEIETNLTPDNHDQAIALASQPLSIRGFGVVKEKAAATANAEGKQLLDNFCRPEKTNAAAE
jgi:indolepyruvate ferredoxin oxidoreductase